MILGLNVANITSPVGMTLMTVARIAEVPYANPSPSASVTSW
jgi:hypothetical protein